MKMVGLSIQSIITTSYFKNTMSYMRKTTEDYILQHIDGVDVSYFKARNFRGTKFRDLAIFWQFRESLEPRNI